MHFSGNQLGTAQTRHVKVTLLLRGLADRPRQAFKRHAELGYLALSTGLSGVTLPGGIPYEEWDCCHSLIVTDELNRVVGDGTYYEDVSLRFTGLFRCSLGI